MPASRCRPRRLAFPLLSTLQRLLGTAVVFGGTTIEPLALRVWAGEVRTAASATQYEPAPAYDETGPFDGRGYVPPAPAGDDGWMAYPESMPASTPAALPWAERAFEIDERFEPIPYADPVLHDPAVADAPPPVWSPLEPFAESLDCPIEPLAEFFARITRAEHDHTPLDLSPFPIGIQPLPPRPPLLYESHDDRFLDVGFLRQGVELPTGAIWRPSVWVFGQYRVHTAWQEARSGRRFAEVAHRLDLFGQLNLSSTERVLIGLRPLDEEVNGVREFNSHDFRTGDNIDGWNGEVQTLFFEGDFGEIFPGLDPYDAKALDYGFSVGRQALLVQQGLLINEDMLDMVTVTRNTLNGHGALNMRVTAAYAWNRINRNDLAGINFRDDEARLYGLFSETDFAHSTVDADLVYLDAPDGRGSLIAYGLSAIQRMSGVWNTYNTSFHILGSHPTDGETTAAGRGELLFSQVSWTPHGTEDLVYVNGFWAIDQFTSPSRGPLMGGPLGQTGLLFAHADLGRYGPALDNQASDAVGGSLGYQMFFDETRQQVVVELGGRQPTDAPNDAAAALGLRFQRAFGQHWIFLVDTFVGKQESAKVSEGARCELLLRF